MVMENHPTSPSKKTKLMFACIIGLPCCLFPGWILLPYYQPPAPKNRLFSIKKTIRVLRNPAREHPVLNRIVIMMLLLLWVPFQAVLCFRVVWPKIIIAGPDPTSTGWSEYCSGHRNYPVPSLNN